VYAHFLLVSPTNRWVWLWSSVVLYLACLPLPGLCVDHYCGNRGIGIVAIGWLGLWGINASNPVNAAWLANPLLFVSWILLFWKRATIIARIVSGAALLAGALLLFADTIGPFNEGSGGNHITGYPLGYWLWLTSMLCAFIAAILTTDESVVASRGQRNRQQLGRPPRRS
jgi:Na+/proline symporter